MKKIMWIIAMLPMAVTITVFQFIPDTIPAHYDLEGIVDRWGNKTESFILPVAILLITLFWHLMAYVFEKNAVKAKTEKERVKLESSAKVFCIVGVFHALMFGIMHFYILYLSYVQGKNGVLKAAFDILNLYILNL